MTGTQKSLAGVGIVAALLAGALAGVIYSEVGAQDPTIEAALTTTVAPTTTTVTPATTTTLPPTTTTVAPTTTTTAAPVEIAPEEQGPEEAFVYNVKEFMVDRGHLEVFDFEDDAVIAMGEEMCNIVDSYIDDGYSPEDAMTELFYGALKRDDPELMTAMYIALLAGSPPVFCPERQGYVDEMFEFADSFS